MKYRDAGVDIEGADRFVARIRDIAARAPREGMLGQIGLFSGAFRFPAGDYREPVLVSGTDGVGTKILLAEILGRYDTIGLDLVAMSVNDIITCGARPLFFLDYLAVGKLDRERDIALVEGIVEGCCRAGCALLGGETAEMPGVYAPGGFDLAGFAVGVVEKSRMLPSQDIAPGDRLVGVASSGLHSNGYSLVRRIFPPDEILADPAGLGSMLLEPTRIYASLLGGILDRFRVKGVAHVTGGGLVDNIPRILPPGTRAVVERCAWPRPRVFRLVEERGAVPEAEMDRTFNQGIGLVMVLDPAEADRVLAFLGASGEKAWLIGTVAAGEGAATCLVG